MYATMLTVVLLVAEMWLPSDWKLLFAHTLAVMIMGSWLFHMAFILFPRNGIPWHQGIETYKNNLKNLFNTFKIVIN